MNTLPSTPLGINRPLPPSPIAHSASTSPLRRIEHQVMNEEQNQTLLNPSPVVHEPRKKQKSKHTDDGDVWDQPDAEILGAIVNIMVIELELMRTIAMDRRPWFSRVYDHYKVELHRVVATRMLYHRFVCKYGDRYHTPIDQPRMKTSNGTTNLGRSAHNCDVRRGVVDAQSIKDSPEVGPYSEACHCTVIALRCASSSRAAQLVTDKWYRKEVELLRPGTSIPSEHTVSRDLKLLHRELATEGQAYFMVCAVFLDVYSQLNSTSRRETAVFILPLMAGQTLLPCLS
jgi:hypothetical protein